MTIEVFINMQLIASAFIFGSIVGVTAGWLCGCGYGFIYGLWHGRKKEGEHGR